MTKLTNKTVVTKFSVIFSMHYHRNTLISALVQTVEKVIRFIVRQKGEKGELFLDRCPQKL